MTNQQPHAWSRCVAAAVLLTWAFAPLQAQAGWEKVWGPTELVIIDNGSNHVYAKPFGGSGDVYRWLNGQWIPLGKPAKGFATAGPAGNSALYCVSSDNIAFRFTGTPGKWESLGGPTGGREFQLFGGVDGLFALDPETGNVYQANHPRKPEWKNLGGEMKYVAVGTRIDPNGPWSVFALSRDTVPPDKRGVFQLTELGQWKKIGGPAGQIIVSRDRFFATNPTSGDLMAYSPAGWRKIGGPGRAFVGDGHGSLFALSPDGQGVFRWTGVPNQWERIGGAAGRIFAGGDHLLFATNPTTRDLMQYKESPTWQTVPNFASAQVTEKLRPVSGTRRVLVILWDPQRPSHPAPPREAVEEMMFGVKRASLDQQAQLGPGPCVADWFRENSGGKVQIAKAGVLGWYRAKKPASHYWDETKTKDPKDLDKDGFLEGHVEKWHEAIQMAASDFNFAAHDTNGDKTLTSQELAILIAIPQNSPSGYVRTPASREFPAWAPLVVQGVTIPSISEWYLGNPVNFGAAAHELCHHFLDAADTYQNGHWPHRPGVYSIMDVTYLPVHLDPFHKLKLGWLDWRAVTKPGVYTLKDVETRHDALIPYNPKRGTTEYFLIENRWRGNSYDKGYKNQPGLPTDGIAIWHVIEDPAVFNQVTPFPPTGVKGEWGRLGLRLIRANGGTPADDALALFRNQDERISDDTKPANLRWLDGSPSGFEVRLLKGPGPEVPLEISVKSPS